MSPLAALSTYAALLSPVLTVAIIFWALGFLFSARIKPQGPGYETSRRESVLRWAFILLGGPICTLLLACLIGLIGGELRPESQILTIGLVVLAGVTLVYVASRAFMAAFALGILHGVRANTRKLARTAPEAGQA